MMESSLFSDLLLLTDLNIFMLLTNDSFSLANEFIDPAGISSPDAAPSADHSNINGTHHHRLEEELLLGAYIGDGVCSYPGLSLYRHPCTF